jgi:hypothetical protein
MVPSLYSRRAGASRVLAFGCFWTAHVAAAVVLAAIVVTGMGRPIHSGSFGELLLLGVFESTLDGIGFVLAVILSPRPATGLRPRYYLLAACTGVISTLLTTAVLLGVGSTGPLPPPVLFSIPVVLTAVVARICLSASFATRLLESDAGESPCAVCGEEPDGPELFCRACGNPR